MIGRAATVAMVAVVVWLVACPAASAAPASSDGATAAARSGGPGASAAVRYRRCRGDRAANVGTVAVRRISCRGGRAVARSAVRTRPNAEPGTRYRVRGFSCAFLRPNIRAPRGSIFCTRRGGKRVSFQPVR